MADPWLVPDLDAIGNALRLTDRETTAHAAAKIVLEQLRTMFADVPTETYLIHERMGDTVSCTPREATRWLAEFPDSSAYFRTVAYVELQREPFTPGAAPEPSSALLDRPQP